MPTNRMTQAADRLASRLKSRASDIVTYTRESVADELLTGWFGNEQEDVVTPGGKAARVDSSTRTFSFLASDLAMGEPLVGDRIEHDGQTWELKATAGNFIWRWSDNTQRIRRVFLKQVA